jgi:hypothetical protein
LAAVTQIPLFHIVSTIFRLYMLYVLLTNGLLCLSEQVKLDESFTSEHLYLTLKIDDFSLTAYLLGKHESTVYFLSFFRWFQVLRNVS